MQNFRILYTLFFLFFCEYLYYFFYVFVHFLSFLHTLFLSGIHKFVFANYLFFSLSPVSRISSLLIPYFVLSRCSRAVRCLQGRVRSGRSGEQLHLEVVLLGGRWPVLRQVRLGQVRLGQVRLGQVRLIHLRYYRMTQLPRNSHTTPTQLPRNPDTTPTMFQFIVLSLILFSVKFGDKHIYYPVQALKYSYCIININIYYITVTTSKQACTFWPLIYKLM